MSPRWKILSCITRKLETIKGSFGVIHRSSENVKLSVWTSFWNMSRKITTVLFPNFILVLTVWAIECYKEMVGSTKKLPLPSRTITIGINRLIPSMEPNASLSFNLELVTSKEDAKRVISQSLSWTSRNSLTRKRQFWTSKTLPPSFSNGCASSWLYKAALSHGWSLSTSRMYIWVKFRYNKSRVLYLIYKRILEADSLEWL